MGTAAGKGCRATVWKSSILKQSECAGLGSGKCDGALDKFAGEVGQAQQAINLARQLRKHLGAFAVQFGLMQVVGDFEHHGNLRGQGAGAANILLRDAGVVEAVEHAEHAEHFSVGAEQRDGQQLPGLILRENLQVRAGQLS